MDGITTAPALPADADYDTDFYAWSMEQARLIRGLTIPGLDNENVAEEIESLGRSDKRELLSRGTVLLVHLLKWQFQAERRGESWSATIDEQPSRHRHRPRRKPQPSSAGARILATRVSPRLEADRA